jgi:hypothetical protein
MLKLFITVQSLIKIQWYYKKGLNITLYEKVLWLNMMKNVNDFDGRLL